MDGETSHIKRNAKNKELLKVENLSFSYPNKQKVLENVNLLIYEGEIVALLGHNGAGKSTLAHSLIGINKMKNGKIALKGEDISSWSIRKRGEIISYVMQNPNHMITQPTVFEEVSFTLTLHNFSKEEIKNKVEGILKFVAYIHFVIGQFKH